MISPSPSGDARFAGMDYDAQCALEWMLMLACSKNKIDVMD